MYYNGHKHSNYFLNLSNALLKTHFILKYISFYLKDGATEIQYIQFCIHLSILHNQE